MTVRRFSASTLIGIVFAASGGSVSLQHLAPLTLAPVGQKVQLRAFGFAGWEAARRGRLLVLSRPRYASQPAAITVLDEPTLRVLRSIDPRGRDVCSVAFDGPTLVALTATPWCWSSGPLHGALLRIDPGTGAVSRTFSTEPLRAFVWPVSVASGDGRMFVSRSGGSVDAVDLRSGAVVSHRPPRSLAKGEGRVAAHWLGRHRLGLNGTIVDVRTWRSRTLLAGGRGIASNGPDLVAWGPRGASVFDQSGRFRRHVLGDEDVSTAIVLDRTLYATVGSATDVVDLRTGTRLRVVPSPYLGGLLEF